MLHIRFPLARRRGAPVAVAAVRAAGHDNLGELLAEEQRHQGTVLNLLKARACGCSSHSHTRVPPAAAAAPDQVWYEWCAMGETSTRIQNPDGRSYFIGL